ncbi:hypothetical protein CTU88_20470 [Streptomyces sp. JV178]|uniref:hypothetical protein n=1 Tax=Streptomyces sp. JV178 TaxID=858632 RepID=UPI000C1B1932|nr:hypothetical protein [Streptomyces sp. JV178]PIM70882.1 hypothetical protein CTU88_20470 [Streptomyces sp. JV178]
MWEKNGTITTYARRPRRPSGTTTGADGWRTSLRPTTTPAPATKIAEGRRPLAATRLYGY